MTMTMTMGRWLAAIALAATPASAQQAGDIDAVARSVVRVIVVDDPTGAGTGDVNMGSGVAVTANRIVTNAHVVEAAVERGGLVGVVPSEGRQRYEGRVVAYDPTLDLAVIALSSGRIEPAALFGGIAADGTAVVALGYPYGVDRAMASGIDELVRPQAPVKSLGHVGGHRSNARFDAILHDANIGRGNSGGPLVDVCGRVIGINSFLSVSDGIDAPFAFALSVRELTAFLRKANVAPTVVTTPCLSDGEAAARDANITQAERDRAAADSQRQANAAARVDQDKQRFRDTIATERDNGLAIAGGLLIAGAIAVIGAMLLFGRHRRSSWAAMATGAAAMLAAVIVFFARPAFSAADDRYLIAHPAPPSRLSATGSRDGGKLCVFDPERSRVTVSKTSDVALLWRDDGCMNGKTQYGANAGLWSRTFVPNGEATITIQSFDPAASRYTVTRYLMAADAMTNARVIRGRYKNQLCTADAAQRQSVTDLETSIRTVLPQRPNERLVFDCRNQRPG